MKTKCSITKTVCPTRVARHLGITGAFILLLLVLALPPSVQAQFDYTTNSGAVTITGYNGPGGSVTIPKTIDGLPVTSIGNYVFMMCARLTSVTIPNNITHIGQAAFQACNGLTSATIPNSVTSIGDLAFGGCWSLTNVVIPDSVTNIGNRAFSSCTYMSAIRADALNPFYSSVDGVLFNKSKTILIQCPGGKAGSYAIPNSVTGIGDSSFEGCLSLTNVNVPSSVVSIGNLAFFRCTSLTSVKIPESVTSIGSSGFESCWILTSVIIPNSVTSIGDLAFHSCGSLTDIIIPKSVTRIGNRTFENCASLKAVHFQGNAPSLGEDVFNAADDTTIYYLPGTTGWSAAFGERPTALWKQ